MRHMRRELMVHTDELNVLRRYLNVDEERVG